MLNGIVVTILCIFQDHSTISPDDCWSSKWDFSLFFIIEIGVQKSEFLDEPWMIVPLYLPSSSGRLFSSMFPIKLFHILHALNTKLFLEISRETIGNKIKKFASLDPWKNKLYKETGDWILSILKVFMNVWYVQRLNIVTIFCLLNKDLVFSRQIF